MKPLIEQERLPELVYEAVLDAICEGRLKPGERLMQDDLAHRLNVSRLPVGQALRELKADGFVADAGRRGVKVAPLDPEFVRELYEFRSVVDMVAAGAAARRADGAAREHGERIIRKGRTAVAMDDVPGMIAADMEFHYFVYELSGNRVIVGDMQSHWNHMRRVMRNILGEGGLQGEIWREHQTILNAICAGNIEEAETRARAHVQDAAVWLHARLLADGAEVDA